MKMSCSLKQKQLSTSSQIKRTGSETHAQSASVQAPAEHALQIAGSQRCSTRTHADMPLAVGRKIESCNIFAIAACQQLIQHIRYVGSMHWMAGTYHAILESLCWAPGHRGLCQDQHRPPICAVLQELHKLMHECIDIGLCCVSPDRSDREILDEGRLLLAYTAANPSSVER